jgi:hypothetical protein
MIRVCMTCKEVFGEKEPLEDKSETHGLCERCFPLEMGKIEKIIRSETPRRGVSTGRGKG